MKNNIFSAPFDIGNEPTLKASLKKSGFEFSTVNHAFWKAKRAGLNITFYKSGKLVIQGNGAVEFARSFLDISDQNQGLEHITKLNAWVGSDEAGKGDFFGPLVVAAVYVNKQNIRDLVLLQVQDSKKMTDNKIQYIAESIKQNFNYAVKIIEPEKYNRIYLRFANLNRLLAHAHGEVITQLITKFNCDAVLIDKFGNEALLKNELKLGVRTKLVQLERAEINPAVAAAAIIARSCFVDGINRLSQKYQIELPKGASEQVISAGKKFIQIHGQNTLKKVAKLHFKTVQKL